MPVTTAKTSKIRTSRELSCFETNVSSPAVVLARVGSVRGEHRHGDGGRVVRRTLARRTQLGEQRRPLGPTRPTGPLRQRDVGEHLTRPHADCLRAVNLGLAHGLKPRAEHLRLVSKGVEGEREDAPEEWDIGVSREEDPAHLRDKEDLDESGGPADCLYVGGDTPVQGRREKGRSTTSLHEPRSKRPNQSHRDCAHDPNGETYHRGRERRDGGDEEEGRVVSHEAEAYELHFGEGGEEKARERQQGSDRDCAAHERSIFEHLPHFPGRRTNAHGLTPGSSQRRSSFDLVGVVRRFPPACLPQRRCRPP